MLYTAVIEIPDDRLQGDLLGELERIEDATVIYLGPGGSVGEPRPAQDWVEDSSHGRLNAAERPVYLP